VSGGARHLVAFAVVLLALAGAGAAAGRLIDPSAPGGRSEERSAARAAEMDAMGGAAGADTHGTSGGEGGAGAGTHGTSGGEGGAGADTHGASGADADSHGADMAGMSADPVRGLAVADHGLRLEVDDPDLRRGAAERLRFRIVDTDGRPVRDFDVEHTKRMHLIVVRRDMTGFQHLHPRMRADGTWTTPVRLPAAGSYRLFADFAHDGEATTLAGDIRVDGPAELRALPAVTPSATSADGYDVRLAARALHAGQASDLRFTVTKGGRPVQTEPYLGAGGHLVALREGDLAFLHVHPSKGSHPGEVGFAATFPTPGRYRLFLQFQVAGRVQTVAFTQEVQR
jgi:hypothetical protein